MTTLSLVLVHYNFLNELNVTEHETKTLNVLSEYLIKIYNQIEEPIDDIKIYSYNIFNFKQLIYPEMTLSLKNIVDIVNDEYIDHKNASINLEILDRFLNDIVLCEDITDPDIDYAVNKLIEIKPSITNLSKIELENIINTSMNFKIIKITE